MINQATRLLRITGVQKGKSIKMKSFIAFAFLIAGISANVLPSDIITKDSRFVTDTIVDAIDDLSQSIKDAGFDPLIIKKEVFSYALPVPTIFNAAAFVEDVLSTGVSNIVVNHINYALLASRLDFNIELPHIHLSAYKVIGEANLFRETVNAEVVGSVDIKKIVVIGSVHVNIGIISGISIGRVDIDFTLGSIDTNLGVAIQGNNYSVEINEFLSETIPDVLTEFKEDIDELIEIILLDILNENI